MANIKLGQTVLNGVTTLQVEDADNEGTYIDFGQGGGGIAGGYNVLFNSEGEDYQFVSVLPGSRIKEPFAPTVEGVVVGWSTDEQGQNLVSFPYTPSADVTLYAKVSPVDPVLNNNGWDVIHATAVAEQGDLYWAIGDAKEITLNGTVGATTLNSNYLVYILDFNHNSAVEGVGISFGGFRTTDGTHIEVCLCSSGYGSTSSSENEFTMNTTNVNAGGWEKSHMRYTILGSTDTQDGDASATTATSPVPNTLMSCLPSDLRAVMQPISKWTSNGTSHAQEVSVYATVDYLPLLAEFEVFGVRTRANSYEQNHQTQYEYFVSGSKIKYKHTDVNKAVNWWLRSPYSSSTSSFCYVYGSGSVNAITADNSCGVSPAFLV